MALTEAAEYMYTQRSQWMIHVCMLKAELYKVRDQL